MMVVDSIKENNQIAKEYKELLKISYQSLSKDDRKLIRLAFNTSVDAHKNQRRKSGEPYVFHPISVAKIVASKIGLDATCIATTAEGDSASVEIVGENAVEDLLDDGKLNNSNTAASDESEESPEAAKAEPVATEADASGWSDGEDPWAE